MEAAARTSISIQVSTTPLKLSSSIFEESHACIYNTSTVSREASVIKTVLYRDSINMLRQRLMHDIAELQRRPYPNISLILKDEDTTKACLILHPNGDIPLHLTVIFGDNYPLSAPRITIQSTLLHPNVYSSYICASILNTDEGYTPAYTLKGIAIQLLSFFASNKMEQIHTATQVELARYRASPARFSAESSFHCSRCNFDELTKIIPTDNRSTNLCVTNALQGIKEPISCNQSGSKASREKVHDIFISMIEKLIALPQELILLTLAQLDTEELLALSACDRIRVVIADSDLIRLRELECFCLKKSFEIPTLGVGVYVGGRRGKATFSSEFDLLSKEAFDKYKIRKSVQGLPFQHWMPLPISRRHWQIAKQHTDMALASLTHVLNSGHGGSKASVLYQFMNNVVVQFSRTAGQCFISGRKCPTSSLSHASEKAIESYFALFPQLICITIEDEGITKEAERVLKEFQEGKIYKAHCPDLGHLLVGILVCEQDMT